MFAAPLNRKYCLTISTRPSFNFTARSTLPVGAGLGSSASFSTCAATTVLLLHQRISIPSLPRPAHQPHDGDPGHIHVSHQGRRAIAPTIAEEVNRWAFVAEKILHGNPSGVDNSVAVFGGALAYTRAGFGKKSGMESIQGYVFLRSVVLHVDFNWIGYRFKSLRFLLTNSKVPRDTKKLVAGVGERKRQVRILTLSIEHIIADCSQLGTRAHKWSPSIYTEHHR